MPIEFPLGPEGNKKAAHSARLFCVSGKGQDFGGT